MSAPPDDEGRPPAKERPRNVTAGDTHIVPPTGCPCGCAAGEPCVTDRPVNMDADPWCCGSYGVDALAKGYGCPRHTLRSA